MYSVSGVGTSYKIGVDGGGTKTSLILTDATGTIVSQRITTGCNPSLIGDDAVHRLLDENIKKLVADATLAAGATFSHTVLCMAGSRVFWNAFAKNLSGFGQAEAFDDSIPVLELATGGAPGLVLHAGTGSFVCARGRDSVAYYAGGLGWRFGDPGSAYDLGRRAVARTLLELQGWADPSDLGRAICKATHYDNAPDLIRHFYAPDTPNTACAALAPYVTACAAHHDSAAVTVLRDSLTELGHLATAVRHRLFESSSTEKLPVGLSGVILHSPIAREVLEKEFGPQVDFRFITEAPIEGVRRLLARL